MRVGCVRFVQGRPRTTEPRARRRASGVARLVARPWRHADGNASGRVPRRGHLGPAPARIGRPRGVGPRRTPTPEWPGTGWGPASDVGVVITDRLAFELPPSLEAAEPPKGRGSPATRCGAGGPPFERGARAQLLRVPPIVSRARGPGGGEHLGHHSRPRSTPGQGTAHRWSSTSRPAWQRACGSSNHATPWAAAPLAGPRGPHRASSTSPAGRRSRWSSPTGTATGSGSPDSIFPSRRSPG